MNTALQKTPSVGIQETSHRAEKISTRSALIIVFLLQIILAAAQRYFSYIGDSDQQMIQQILAHFTIDDIANGIKYHRAGFTPAVVAKLISILLTILFVFMPFSKRIEDYLSSRSKNSFVLLCLYFLTIYLIIKTLVSLPFNYYFGFILEHQFGFSRMTNGEWILLTLKNIGLSFVIWIPLEIGALLLLKHFKRTWVFIVPIASFVLALLWTAVWPLVVTPLFYSYEPLAESSLKNKIIALTKEAHIDIENIYTINESRYSNHTNAYFVGWGSNRKIFLYDTLITNHTEDEVISVLGHEIGHWQQNHSVKKILLSSVLLFIGCIVTLWIFNLAKREGKLQLVHLYSPSTAPFIFLLSSFISLVTDPVESAYSRSCELEADAIALNLTRDPESFIEAHKKMARENKARLNPHPFTTYWFSHPTTLKRISMAEDYRKLRAGPKRGD